MCSPYYCPTLELKFKLKCSPHCKGVDYSVKSVQHLKNIVLLQKKKKEPDSRCTACLCHYIVSPSFRSLGIQLVFFLSNFPFSNANIQAFQSSHPKTVCLKSCPSASGRKAQTHVTATHLAYKFNIFARCQFELHCSE